VLTQQQARPQSPRSGYNKYIDQATPNTSIRLKQIQLHLLWVAKQLLDLA
jgi:hypothetical protein